MFSERKWEVRAVKAKQIRAKLHPDTQVAPPLRRRFGHKWDEVVYVHSRILYWYYVRNKPAAAKRLCSRLTRLLHSLARFRLAIIRAECWWLIFELRGDFQRAIRWQRRHLKLLERLLDLGDALRYDSIDLMLIHKLLAINYLRVEKVAKAVVALEYCESANASRSREVYANLRLRLINSCKEELNAKRKHQAPNQDLVQLLTRKVQLYWAKRWAWRRALCPGATAG